MIVLPIDGRVKNRFKKRFSLALEYAFEGFGKIKSQKHILKDLEKVEKKLNGEEVKDSRFEAVKFII